MKYGLGEKWKNAYETVELPDTLSGIREAFQVAFGGGVRAVMPTSDKFDIFNGVQIKEAPKSVYVNVKSRINLMSVASHELGHILERDPKYWSRIFSKY